MSNDSVYTPLSEYVPASVWPSDLLQEDSDTFLDAIAYEGGYILELDDEVTAELELRVMAETTFDLPAGFALVFGGGSISALAHIDDEGFEVYLKADVLAIRLPRKLFVPVIDQNGELIVDPDPSHFVDIQFPVALSANSSGNIRFSWPGETTTPLSLPPCMIGQSGVIISADDIVVRLSDDDPLPANAVAAGVGNDWHGVYIGEAAVHLPKGLASAVPSDLAFTDCFIGSGGFSGSVAATWSSLSGTLFGIPCSLKGLAITFVQNALTECSISASVTLPFFDAPADVDISFSTEGKLLVGLSSSSGLAKLTKPGVVDLTLDSIVFAVDHDLFTVKISGQLTPLFGGLTWPTFDVKELSIDSKGHVHLDGGWLKLPEQKTFDFYGFKIEITQLGFGKNDDGGKWIGFSGGVHLVDGLPQGVSVEGLRITWYEDGSLPKISMNGVGLELLIPDVLYFKGAVSYREIKATDGSGSVIHRFDGDIRLVLATPELDIDGTIVIGSVNGPQGRYNFFAIYVDADLPVGIPLAATGLAFYGFAGLFALQMEPDKHADEMWFSIDHSKSFYHRNTPGITDLAHKWGPKKGSFAIGAGVTLGTMSDNGYSFYGKFLLAIIIPGPIILLQGAAQFLKKQKDANDEGQFRALAVLDGRAGSILIGLDAEYKTGKGGEMIEIGGSMEAFYAFHDPMAWHLWLGKDEPRSLRIRALFGRFVEANAYFMLDAHALALGAWFGYSNGWTFGPLSVRLEAWAEGNAKLSFKPSHFHGDVSFHCLVELGAFGLKLGIAIDAMIAADLFTPYHLIGTFSVGIKIPFRKKKIGATVTLEWGPHPTPPPLPLPVKQIAVEHLKSTVVWPLPRDKYLLPNWDDGEGFVRTPPTGVSQPDPTMIALVPVVPLDARISVTFGRSVNDDAQVGVTQQTINPYLESIGPPGGPAVATVRYSLQAIELSRRETNGSWQLVAKSPTTAGVPALFGSWMAVPQLPGTSATDLANSKLLLWEKSPFAFTRATGSSWAEWVSNAIPGYPCIPVLPSVETCFDFEEIKPGALVKSPWVHHGPPDVTLSWGFGPATAEVINVVTGTERHQLFALCFPEAAVRSGITVRSSEPGRALRIVFAPAPPVQPVPGPVQQPVPSPTTGATQVVAPGAITPAVAEAIFNFGVPGTCVDIRQHEAGTLVNPWNDAGVRFAVFGANGVLLQQARVERWGKSPLGLNAGFQLDIELPCASPWVELIVTHRPPFRIIAFNGVGTAVATHAPLGTGDETTETIRLQGEGITRLEVHASGNEKLVHSVCYQCTQPVGTVVTWYDTNGNPHGPIVPTGDTIVVPGPRFHHLVLTGDSGLCIAKICVTPDPDKGQAVGREEMIEHTREQLVHWHDEGDVLAPNTTYRLKVQTLVDVITSQVSLSDVSPEEYAYFRTEGPPGLTKLPPPDGLTTKDFDSGLDDLVRYVRETDPPTVPPAGEKPILFRPFYRAYDIGVEFNENYVEQMYRMDRRDLGLYLFDNSNQPVRDTKGRLLVLESRWGEAPTVTLTEDETLWITLIDAATCLPKKLDPVTFPHPATLTSSTADRVLAPDTLHEARLVPLLLHETFAGLPLGDLAAPSSGWYVDDSGSGGPSRWQIGEVGEPPSRFVAQLSPIGSTTPDRSGTLLILADDSGNPAEWTDYRVSVYVRSDAGGAVGLVVRYLGAGTGYRFALDSKVRSLVKLGPGLPAEVHDHFAYQKKRDYLLTVEALGSVLRAYVDGEPVFELTDATYAKGRIGLYVCESPGARFSDVVIDDLRLAAPVAYRFQLTTSLYANFFHHLHSFQDETWKATLAGGPDVDPMLNAALAPSFSPPDESEARAYETLAGKVLGSAALQNSERVEITRVDRAGNAPIFLLRSPEPIDPKRTELTLSQSARSTPLGIAPAALKLTDAVLGANRPEDESVTLLLRDGAELTRQRIELRQLPGPLSEMVGDPLLLLESFLDQGSLARFTIVDAPDAGGSSLWQIESGGLVEVSGVGGGNEPELPGTLALAGNSAWTDYRLTVDLRADAGGEVGVLFRYRDDGNYYRLSIGAALSHRRLVKCVEGVMIILWQDARGYSAGEPFRLTIEAVGSRLVGFVGETPVFDIRDNAHAAGLVGLYASSNPGVRCERIEVRLPSLQGRTWLTDRFAEGQLADWTLLPEAPNDASSVAWGISAGTLHLDHLVAAGNDPAYPGAYAASGDVAWTDEILQARVRSGGGAIGVVVRARDIDNYYRFSMSRDNGYRQLVKKVAGTLTVLWRDAFAYEANRTYELTVVAIGSSLRGYVDGVPLFSVHDADIPAGRIALYSWNNHDAWYSDIAVWPGDQAFNRWRMDDPFTALVPDRWRFANDAGTSEPEWWTMAGGVLQPAATPPPGGGTSADIAAAVTTRRRASSPPDTFHYALLAQPDLADMRLAVRLELDANGAAGVVFGWQDAANHLVFWLDTQRDGRRLLRTHASTVEVLWEDAVRPDAGHQTMVTIDQLDGRLVGHLDGVQIFSLDAVPVSGGAGVALRAGATARFGELRLALPEWTCWYGFGEEEQLPAGTRIRVHAAPATAAPQEAGLLLRSAALAGEHGRLRLPEDGAALRVVGADGQSGHARTLLPNSAFAPLGMRALRKADGTAFFFIPAAAQPAIAGALRLNLTYHRDRAEAGRPMSQAGDRGPEHVTIEFGE